MRQTRVYKEHRVKGRRDRDALVGMLPLDPRDPEIVRAKRSRWEPIGREHHDLGRTA